MGQSRVGIVALASRLAGIVTAHAQTEIAMQDNGTQWISQVSLEGGLKPGPNKIESPHKKYFDELHVRHKDVDYFFGSPLLHYRGKCGDAYAQVMNGASPAGLLSMSGAASRVVTVRPKG